VKFKKIRHSLSSTVELFLRGIISLYSIIVPLLFITSKIVHISETRFQRYFTATNNSLTKALFKNKKPHTVLVEVGSCLQLQTCTQNIKESIFNCERCGKCQIKEIAELAEKYDVKTQILSGGALACKFVKEVKPDVVLAIACENELISGIQSVAPFPVFGIINERPEGPCRNTRVKIESIKEAIEYFCSKNDVP
jgi:hypothetical protein